jgi:Ulp1 family protease
MWSLNTNRNPQTGRTIASGGTPWIRLLKMCAQQDLCSAWAVSSRQRNPITGRKINNRRGRIQRNLTNQCGNHPPIYFRPLPNAAHQPSSSSSSSEEEDAGEEDDAAAAPPAVDQVDAMLAGQGDGQLVGVDRENLGLTVHDVRTLGDGRWLNDQVINYVIAMIREQNPPPLTVIMSTFFYTKLMKGNVYNYNRVRRWFRKLSPNNTVAQVGRIFVPIHLNQNHWILTVIDMLNHQIQQYDSLNAANTLHPNLLQNLQRWIADQSNQQINPNGWPLVAVQTPQQQNGYDCGVFTLLTLRRLVSNQPLTFNQGNIPNTRIQIATDIIQNNLSF